MSNDQLAMLVVVGAICALAWWVRPWRSSCYPTTISRSTCQSVSDTQMSRYWKPTVLNERDSAMLARDVLKRALAAGELAAHGVTYVWDKPLVFIASVSGTYIRYTNAGLRDDLYVFEKQPSFIVSFIAVDTEPFDVLSAIVVRDALYIAPATGQSGPEELVVSEPAMIDIGGEDSPMLV